MAESEGGIGLADVVAGAALVDCLPAPDPAPVPLPAAPEGGTPADRARDETLGQTGADPPPPAPTLTSSPAGVGRHG